MTLTMTCEQCGLLAERPTRTVEQATPFPEYFGQNVCVEPATARRVANFLSNARKEEEEMASDIRMMKASLAQMKAKHVAAKRLIAKHAVLLSHVHRLPDEILEQIFLFLPAASTMTTIPPASRGDRGKWYITWVCRQWRTVAIQVAQLWYAVKIGDSHSSADNISPLLELSLCRARGMRPSLLCLDISTNLTEATDALIVKYSAYIWFLRYRIYVEETGLPDDLQLDSLKQLEVIVDTDREAASDSDSESVKSTEIPRPHVNFDLGEYLSPFRRCTSLKSFDLSIDTHNKVSQYFSKANIEPEGMELLWNNLCLFTLHIKDDSLFPLDDILAACQKLEYLEVVGYRGSQNDPASPACLELPRLSTFQLSVGTEHGITLPTFNVPSLQILSLEALHRPLRGSASLFCISQLSRLCLKPCDHPHTLREWRDMVATMGRPLDCLDLHVDQSFEDYESSDVSGTVFPLAQEVRIEFLSLLDGGFVELMRWVQEDNNYLESLTLVFKEWDTWDARISWRKENRDCDYPTEDEMLEWAKDRLRRSDFMVRVNSIACTGVNVKMIAKGRYGSETRVENDYLNV